MSSIYQSSYSLCFKLSTVWICINLATASFSYTILGEIWQNLLPITQLSFTIKGGVIPSNLTNSLRTFLPFLSKIATWKLIKMFAAVLIKRLPD